MEKRIEFQFEYDYLGDVLSIFDYDKPISESIEFNEFINIDLNKHGGIVGLEIFDVSKFLGILNKEIDQKFLKSLDKVELIQADYRNNIFIAIISYSNQKQICQQLPPLQKRDYVSLLVDSV